MRGSVLAYLHLLSNTPSSSGKSSSRLNQDHATRMVGVVEVANDVVLTTRPREVTPTSASTERWLSHYPSDRNDFCLECGIKKAVEVSQGVHCSFF
jgi:hypothetical protein